jgi:hypothetical protein
MTGTLTVGGWDGPVTDVGAGVPAGNTGSVQLLVAAADTGAATTPDMATKITVEPNDRSKDPTTHLFRKRLRIGSPRLWLATLCRHDLAKQKNHCQGAVLVVLRFETALNRPGGPPPEIVCVQWCDSQFSA